MTLINNEDINIFGLLFIGSFAFFSFMFNSAFIGWVLVLTFFYMVYYEKINPYIIKLYAWFEKERNKDDNIKDLEKEIRGVKKW